MAASFCQTNRVVARQRTSEVTVQTTYREQPQQTFPPKRSLDNMKRKFAGNKQAWENALRARNQGQTEYNRIK